MGCPFARLASRRTGDNSNGSRRVLRGRLDALRWRLNRANHTPSMGTLSSVEDWGRWSPLNKAADGAGMIPGRTGLRSRAYQGSYTDFQHHTLPPSHDPAFPLLTLAL